MLFALQIRNVITASIGQEVNSASARASLNFERRELLVVSLALALALLAS